MSLRFVGSLVLCGLVPVMAPAEDNCGQMMRTMSRFRGTVRSVEPIGDLPVTANVVDLDPKFVVTMQIEGAEEPVVFAIHSPARTFIAENAVGETFDLEAERMDCDGAFRRYISLGRRSPTPIVESFDGDLEVGHTYRAAVKVTEGRLELVKRLDLPRHHGGGVGWSNREAFPQLSFEGEEEEIVFEVLSREITHMDERRWLTLFDAKIVAAE